MYLIYKYMLQNSCKRKSFLPLKIDLKMRIIKKVLSLTKMYLYSIIIFLNMKKR